jgi:hypothetical protein
MIFRILRTRISRISTNLFSLNSKNMITVGTPGLGVRHPDGKSSGWEILRMENHPEGKSSGGKILRRENHPEGKSSGWKIIRMENHPDGKSSGWKIIRRENR